MLHVRRPRVPPRPFQTRSSLMNTASARRAALAAVLALGLAVASKGAAAAKSPKPAKGAASAPASAVAPLKGAEEHTLSNGMKLLLIPRHLSPTIAGGWVAHVGSANERPGITGISHLFEHMMFKGSHVIGTRDYEKDVQLIEEQERTQDQMREELSKM